MHATTLLLCCIGVVTVVATHEQVYMGDNHHSPLNLTLDFDDLKTNSSGIGFDPWTSQEPLHYKDLYFQSFTVVNVAKALNSLPDPVDLLCAASAPNALFSSRREGYVWPRFSLHNLADSDQPRNPNITFDMRSLTFSPTGKIPGPPGKVLVLVRLTLIKLPPDPSTGVVPPGFPGLVRGTPSVPAGKHIHPLSILFGSGTHQSIKLNYDTLRRSVPGFGRNVDVFEAYGELYRRNEEDNAWRVEGDWQLCLDDIVIDVVENSAPAAGDDERVQDRVEGRFVTVTANGSLDYDQDVGEKMWREFQA
ncbi:hypothetical protein LTR10_014594 [Elasticomyces elasticus]|uniref:NADH:ubiquinone oxidoreductase intermediate-associated protein 30 domain-containing protein n=1 Tax=Exophiala sideris TaxID=1016849 RepID=A0ABR0JSM0_9EURO|nr:hypothetical protein LTR10_014594 [Elasticomyces elasticus]KAK5040573.1 hypothetical protein LTS07_001071 [Exophiala sideris]KAK5043003.1 hypothetical protein LTR13_000774 [Exophiala sideris]KAK5068951.1 hypothetical protein LTR69_001072 [Exophiala sideris]KAK5186547.1 hypothetical protein LTR44_001603 [Eurotiomycetes sp. CCFEE 6388]